MNRDNNKLIYMDNQATTPIDPKVLEAMMPYFTTQYGNAHSLTHAMGWDAEVATEEARHKVAKLINAHPKEIVFTSGATESNNLAIKGVANFYKDKKNHIITISTEHKCVLESCRHLEQNGFDVTYLPVNKSGIISLEQLENAIKKNTVLISVMMVNNEIGVIQPTKEIGEICHKHKIFFHTDAAQAFGKIPIDVNEMNIDLMSISGHKIYGPKGIGALYVRKKPRVRLSPIISGGGQERGMRSGTLPVPLVVGLGVASEIAQEEMERDKIHITKLHNLFIDELTRNIPDIYLNGDKNQRIHGNINLSFAYVEGESMLMALKNLAVSSGSACTSASLEPSYVLKSIGVTEDLAHTSIRFGIGRFSTESEIRVAIDLIKESAVRLKKMSPLWDMAQEGIDINSIEWAEH